LRVLYSDEVGECQRVYVPPLVNYRPLVRLLGRADGCGVALPARPPALGAAYKNCLVESPRLGDKARPRRWEVSEISVRAARLSLLERAGEVLQRAFRGSGHDQCVQRMVPVVGDTFAVRPLLQVLDAPGAA